MIAAALIGSAFALTPTVTYAVDAYAYTDKMGQTYWVDTDSIHKNDRFMDVSVKKVGRDQDGPFSWSMKIYYHEGAAGTYYNIKVPGKSSTMTELITHNPLAANVYAVCQQYL